ncbi:hypothetical protein H4R23_000918 [Coemansia sp. Cherry 401B]|nr:hypothetical protein IWW54_000470 [Coemansia sp. RSA 2705]KAJ2320815.1 hypothetical protein IWW52_001130 [Coemansia sp. RSA 2704]KAJ2738769.1 hypothetical protein H4R23_000918 [Coemansia sp. Cherry 401B]
MFGSGCWAEHQGAAGPDNAQVIGCSVSGTGEQIMRTMLAKECAQAKGDIFTALDGCFGSFCATPSLAMYRQRSAGLILLRKAADSDSAELGIAHTTQSMGYGYMSAGMASPRARISRKKESDQAAIVATRL